MNKLTREVLDEIYSRITSKGWSVYHKGRQMSREEAVQQGPVLSLEPETRYVVLPRVDNQMHFQSIMDFVEKWKKGKDPVGGMELVRITIVEDSATYFGRQIIHGLVGKNPTTAAVFPKQSFIMYGFECFPAETELITNHRDCITFLPHRVFLMALETLPDINQLLRKYSKQKAI